MMIFAGRRNWKTLFVFDAVSIVLSVFLFMSSVPSEVGGVYHRIETSDTKTKIIQSDGFPGPYPANVNNSWYWHTDNGYWAVVFFTFVLDLDIYSVRDEDWLEIDDGVKCLRYTNSTPAPAQLVTEGSQLTIRFKTDKKVDTRSLGFYLKVLYGTTTSELPIKIHEAREADKNRRGENQNPPWLVWVIAGLVIFIIIVIVVVVSIVCRYQHHDKSYSRRSPRIRANSGVFHTRNSEIIGHQETQQYSQQNFNRQDSNQQPLLQQQQQRQQQLHHQTSTDSTRDRSMENDMTERGHRPSVQRSNSRTQQMNWILRAELSTSLQTADRKSTPNIYTDTPQVGGACSKSNDLPQVHNCNSNKGMCGNSGGGGYGAGGGGGYGGGGNNNRHNTNVKEFSMAANDVSLDAKNYYADKNNPRLCVDIRDDDDDDDDDDVDVDQHNIYVNNTKTSPDGDQDPFYSNYDFPPPSAAYQKEKPFPEVKETSGKFRAQENNYTNILFSPFASKESDTNQSVNEKGFGPPETSPMGRKYSASVSPDIHPSQNNMLYVNLHVSRSLTDVLSPSDISDSCGVTARQGNPISANLATSDLKGLQARALLVSVSNDNLALDGSDPSLNRIVLSVTQEAGCTTNPSSDMHTAHTDDHDGRARLENPRKITPKDEVYVNVQDLQPTVTSNNTNNNNNNNNNINSTGLNSNSSQTGNRSTSVNCRHGKEDDKEKENEKDNDDEKEGSSHHSAAIDGEVKKEESKNVIYDYPRPTKDWSK